VQVGANLIVSADNNGATLKNVNLVNAKVIGFVQMSGATFGGELNANFLQVGTSLVMHSTEHNQSNFQSVNIVGAKIAGDVVMDGATFDGDLNANSLQVGASLFMRSTDKNKANFQSVNLRNAKVAGNVEMDAATFGGDLDAESMQVGAGLFMRSAGQIEASFRTVTLRGAKVAGNVIMDGATFDGDLNANSLQVGASLFMRNKAKFKNVTLVHADVASDVEFDDATFAGEVIAESLQVGSDLFLRSATFTRPIDMIFAHIGGSLDLRNASLTALDVSGGSITADLRLGRADSSGEAARWRGGDGAPGDLTLHDTRTANLMDTKNAWPDRGHLHLDGLAFALLGGFEDKTAAEMRSRGAGWWDQWARRDPDYSPSPYQQLAAAFAAAGERDKADDIRYLGRVRERETETGLASIWSGFLQWVAGFGIGTYTFRVLYWVIVITVFGARDEKHGFIWCFGASRPIHSD